MLAAGEPAKASDSMDDEDRGHATGRERWTGRRAAVAAFVVAYVAVQVVVAALAWPGPRLARFGWQMYAKPAFWPSFAVVRTDGTVQEAAPAEYMGYVRLEVDVERFLPPHLCRVVPGAAAVRVRPHGGGAKDVACP